VERIHECERGTVPTPPDPTHNFVVTLEPDEFTDEKFRLFENYQRIVHREPPSRITTKGFKSFLCSSPLRRHVVMINGRQRRLGTYHQCYYLDGTLVAVGVLDLLPHSVSAVYFMYHESIHSWSPGKLSAMREAALAAEEGYRWYMMGFYIHTCRKMTYKVDFRPQYALDPETYEWNLFDDDLKRRLDARGYVSLSAELRDGIEAPEDNSETRFKDVGPPGSGEDDDDSGDPNFDWDASLFSRNMPGIPTREEMESLPLDDIVLWIRRRFVRAEDLMNWETGSIDDPSTIKGTIAELVAAVGPACANEVVVTFT
jgi:arginine-tRNA-protein transferase